MKTTFKFGFSLRRNRRLQSITLALLTLLVAAGLVASPILTAPVAAQQLETPNANTWDINVVDGGALFYNMSTRSLRYTSTGVPCVAYGADHLYFACYDSTQQKWVREIVDATNQVGQWASLAFSTGNSPRISYYDAGNNALNFAYKIGTTWYITVVDTPAFPPRPDLEEELSSPAVQELRRQSQPRLPQLGSLLPQSYLDSLMPDNPNAGLVGVYSTIAVGSDNKVHIAYYDGTTSALKPKGALKHAGYDGVTWTIDVVDGGNINVGTWPAIALDSQNNPGISYMDEKYDDLKYAWYDGSWHTTTVDTGDPFDVDSVGPFTSLAYDSNNVPHISYLYNGPPPTFTPKFLRYATENSNGWVTVDLDTNSGQVGWDTSIVIDSNNKVHISYYDYTHGDLKLAEKTGNSFTISTLQSSGDVGRYTSMARYGSTIGLSYMNISSGQYFYQANSGSGWSSPSQIDVSSELGFYTSLATDKLNSGMITYFDEIKDDIKIAFGWGASWNKGVLDGPNSFGPYSSAKFNSVNTPSVAYYDLTNGDLKFAYWYAGAWRYQTVDSNNNVGQYVSLAIDSLDRPHVAYYDATNLDLKYAYANWDATNKVWVWTVQPPLDTGGDVGQFASLGLDSNNKPHITYYDVTNTALKHAYKSPIDVWVSEFADNSAAVGKFGSLAVYDPNTLYVTYYDETNGNLVFGQKIGSTWAAPQIVDGGLPNVNVGQYTSLAFDQNGDGNVSYYDVTNGDLKYAFYDLPAGTWVPETVDSAGNVGLFTSLAINSNRQVGISYFDYTSSDLKFARLAGTYKWGFLPFVVKP